MMGYELWWGMGIDGKREGKAIKLGEAYVIHHSLSNLHLCCAHAPMSSSLHLRTKPPFPSCWSNLTGITPALARSASRQEMEQSQMM